MATFPSPRTPYFTPGAPPAGGGGWWSIGSALAGIAAATAIIALANACNILASAVYWAGFIGFTNTTSISIQTTAINILASAIGGIAATLLKVKDTADTAYHWGGGVLTGMKMFGVHKLWKWIKRAWDYYKRFRKWYQKYIQAPLDRMRKNLQRIYSQFLRPILQLLDLVRSVSRVLAVFNRHLAAKLDAAIWKLEGWIMAPWFKAVRRLNALSSFALAIITRSGLFDRYVFIKTLQRDWRSVWRQLLNNGILPQPPRLPISMGPVNKVSKDFKQFVANETGYFAVTNAAAEDVWHELIAVWG